VSQSTSNGLAQRLRRRAAVLADHARGLAVHARLAKYRQAPTPAVSEWGDRYESGGWDYLGGIHQLNHYSILAGYLGHLRPGTILDVGCGTGLLRARLGGVEFARYVGIDPVEVAIERAHELSDERTEFRVGDMSLPDLGTFDALVFNEILYCVPAPEQLLARAYELIAPGGHMLASNLRHPGDAGLFRMIESRFSPVTEVDLSNDTDRGKRRRRVSIYARL
jgi:2-polyprenyl-3-methyl-5-hydroxy-6-metoxy-1,4-benzoquinol methylase